MNALEAVFAQCSEPGWDGYGAAAVSRDTYDVATRFLETLAHELPANVPLPTPGAIAPGEISFEWYVKSTHLLTLSVASTGHIHYSALIDGEGGPLGTVLFTEQVPFEIWQALGLLYGVRVA